MRVTSAMSPVWLDFRKLFVCLVISTKFIVNLCRWDRKAFLSQDMPSVDLGTIVAKPFYLSVIAPVSISSKNRERINVDINFLGSLTRTLLFFYNRFFELLGAKKYPFPKENRFFSNRRVNMKRERLISSKDFWLTRTDLKCSKLGSKTERLNSKGIWQRVKRMVNVCRH